MNKKKFRNHISIIIENIGGSFIVIMTLLFGNLINNLNDIKEISTINYESHLKEILISFLVLFIICIILIIYQIIIWYKTFIYIDDNAIVIERNTLNKKKNVIGINNISNINTERNLFEMLLGTCKVKLDTNNLSTSDKTDLKIILKKDKAEEFSKYILSLINKDNIEIEDIEIKEDIYDIVASNKDLIKNGLYSINLMSLIILIGSFIITVYSSINNLINDNIWQNIVNIILNSIISLSIFISAFWSLLKGFIKYNNFSIKRKDNKLYLKYGLLKKVEYTIPIDKINGIKINQTLIARLKKRYIVEIINIGLGDEKDEPQSTILLYSTREKIRKDLKLILPEFAECIDFNIEKQPKKVWYVWSFSFISYILFLLLSLIFIYDFMNEVLLISVFVISSILLLIILSAFLNYKTNGISIHDNYLGVSKGFFGRSLTFVKYYKIQYIDFIQNPIAKYFDIQKGKISLLASTLNRFHSLPYFDIKYSEKIKEKILKDIK